MTIMAQAKRKASSSQLLAPYAIKQLFLKITTIPFIDTALISLLQRYEYELLQTKCTPQVSLLLGCIGTLLDEADRLDRQGMAHG